MRKMVLAIVTLLSLAPAPWAAAGCFDDIRNCYHRAARRDNIGDRWIDGLDCELEFVGCVRQKVGGW